MTTQACARCRRPAPDQDSSEFLEWEALDDGEKVICPGCITGAEEQAMDESAMADFGGGDSEGDFERMIADAVDQGYARADVEAWTGEDWARWAAERAQLEVVGIQARIDDAREKGTWED